MPVKPEYHPLPPWPWRDGIVRGQIVDRACDAGVGSWVLLYDETYRVYRRPVRDDFSSGPPLVRYHFRPAQIVGETRRSWVTACDRKLAKKPLVPTQSVAFGLADAEDEIWLASNRSRIAHKILYGSGVPASALRQVAKIISYDDEGE